MEPNTNNLPAPNFDLPQPQGVESGVGVNPNLPLPETNQQTEAHNMELPSAQAPAMAPPAPIQDPAANAAAPVHTSPPQAPLPTQSATVPIADEPLAAEDSDLIEKAWVEKAKAIVEQTKDDPYQQNKEINRVKASYIKKRYNKDIKLSEDQKQ